MIDAAQRRVAVTHQHAHGGRRREDAGHAELFDRDAPVGLGPRMIERAFEDHASCSRRAAARRPCSCGRRSSRCRDVAHQTSSGFRPKHHRPMLRDVDLIAAMRVDRQLRLGGRARCREDVRRLVRLHPLDVADCPSPRARKSSQSMVVGRRHYRACRRLSSRRYATDDSLDLTCPTLASSARRRRSASARRPCPCGR